MTEPLRADRIADGVLPALRPILRGVTVLDEVDSTNRELARLRPAERHAHVVMAECQTAGRGRRERHWHSPAGGNLYMSLGWRFAAEEGAVPALPLVVAIAVADALKHVGLEGHGIKWPNDILAGGRKLAGILVELQSGAGRPTAIIGVGVNVNMPKRGGEDPDILIDRPWTDLESQLDSAHRPCDRNALAAALVSRLLAALQRFEREGFSTFTPAWRRYDLLVGGDVTLELDSGTVCGKAAGVSDQGELILQTGDGGRHAFHAGEVRVYRGIRTF